VVVVVVHLWQLGVRIRTFRRSRRWSCHSVPGLALRFAGQLCMSLVSRILHVVFGKVACVRCLWYCRCALTFAAVSIEEGVGWVSLGVPCSSGHHSFHSGMQWLYLCQPEWVEDGRGMGGAHPLTWMGGGAAFYERGEGM